MRTFLSLLLATWAVFAPSPAREGSALRAALDAGASALANGDTGHAREWVVRALERDRNSIEAWGLRVELARALGDRDELVYALHRRYSLAVAQKLAKPRLAELKAEIEGEDVLAKDLFAIQRQYIDRLVDVASNYEKDGRPHGAIRVWKKVLALDPESLLAKEAVDRIAATPDPSLAGDAKPKDLFADVSEEWMRQFDAEHSEWSEAGELERTHYVTKTDAGYEVMVRAGEAMEQMNAFYREFFRYGGEGDKRSVPRIGLNIFKSRDEYLKLGIGPPVEWSAGHFTGSHVECYVGNGGFEEMTGTLFHEAAHQFVSLATSASGWLNEGLASFFEGTRILANGTVIMNLPANHRLFPLATRMEQGWMASADDGIDPKNASSEPRTAPTFRIVLENQYAWGPPWYAPTWGLVYFLYNYQDPIDGRFVYRDAFHEFINSSGGRVGKGAVENFEEVVLANPRPPIKGVEGAGASPLPKTAEELNAVWKDWILALRDEQQGKLEVARPYKQWGRYAVLDENYETAKEHYEKGLVADPFDVELLMEFADLLASRFQDTDRGAKLVLEALSSLENATPRDEKAIQMAERALGKLDPKRANLTRILDELSAAVQALVLRYDGAGLPMMVMDIAWRFGRDLEFASLFPLYEAAVRKSGRSLEIWELAYNEENLLGWNSQGNEAGFAPDGIYLNSRFGEYAADQYDFQILTMDKVASGDFSMEAEFQAGRGEANFCGFVFGRKDAQSFHGMLYFPGKVVAAEGAAQSAYVDLVSSFGGTIKTWRHIALEGDVAPADPQRTSSGTPWHKLRLDVAGRFVDMYFDGEWVATHEFASLDVLRGSFGLLQGPGKARFRNVRFLARDPRDPASAIQRNVRMEQLRPAEGEAVGGSYLGLVPPWPKLARFVQGERQTFQDVGPVPQLLVFFSIQQNELVRVDDWLRSLAETGRDYGLEILTVCSANDAESLEAYLGEHALPGAVAIDQREGVGIGESFEQYFIRRWNLPRMLLLDVDQKVVWEGDPGFEIGKGYDPSVGSFLDAPLAELVEKRQLQAVRAWTARWESDGLACLQRGDLPAVLPLLREAGELPAGMYASVDRARACLAAIEGAVQALEASAQSMQRDEADPALDVLLEWAPLFSVEVTPKRKKDLKPFLESAFAKDWSTCLKAIERYGKSKSDPAARRAELLELLRTKQGRFVRELLAELEAEGDPSAFEALLAAAPMRPLRWLAASFFGW